MPHLVAHKGAVRRACESPLAQLDRGPASVVERKSHSQGPDHLAFVGQPCRLQLSVDLAREKGDSADALLATKVRYQLDTIINSFDFADWLRVTGRSEPPGGSTDGCGLMGNLDERDNDFDGINCEFCHRMKINDSPQPGEQTFYTENGQFWLDDGDCGGQPCRRGPYDYAGPQFPPHQWMYSAYHEDSVICGTCHNVTNPLETLIDAAGSDTGIPFPVERTYME